MATIEQAITELLTEHGMWPQDTPAVLELVKAQKHTKGIKWNDNIEGYPPQFKASLWVVTKRIALEWIDKNRPQAFYRSLFEDQNA